MERLRQRADFLAAAAGAKAPASGFVLQALNRREDGPVRVGFTVSKKVGNSVERNRVRRRLGHDYVLIGRRAALELPFDRLAGDFTRALGRVHGGGSPPAKPHAGPR
jgi:ribonuclease P protein component